MKEETKAQTEIVRKEAHEGTIWLLRHEIIKDIDKYEALKKISAKDFKRLKD